MKKNWVMLLAVACWLVGCKKEVISGAGSIVTQNRELPAFTAIESHYDIRAVVTYGAIQQVRVQGYENLLAALDLQVHDGVLKLRYSDRYHTIRNSNVVAYIQLPTLHKAVIHGSSDMAISQFHLTGRLDAYVHGSGDIRISNSTAMSSALHIHGSGDIDAKGLQVRQSQARVHGSGNIYTTACEKLDASINGSGDIHYWGNPVVDMLINGSGRVFRH